MRARSRPTGSARTHAVPARTRRAAGQSARSKGTSQTELSTTAATTPAPASATAAARARRDLELRDALRVSREAIGAIRDELDALLRSVQAANAARGSGGAGLAAPPPRAEAIERLARSTRRADAAVRGLSTSSS